MEYTINGPRPQSDEFLPEEPRGTLSPLKVSVYYHHDTDGELEKLKEAMLPWATTTRSRRSKEGGGGQRQGVIYSSVGGEEQEEEEEELPEKLSSGRVGVCTVLP